MTDVVGWRRPVLLASETTVWCHGRRLPASSVASWRIPDPTLRGPIDSLRKRNHVILGLSVCATRNFNDTGKALIGRTGGELKMSSMDVRYYRQRAIQELTLALHADRQDVAAIHEELARRYLTSLDRAELVNTPWGDSSTFEVA